MKQVIIGREKEKEELQRCMNSGRSEFVIVYGRRRVGKTFLVDNFFNGQFDFTFPEFNKQVQNYEMFL